MSNAIKFTPEGGKVTLATAVDLRRGFVIKVTDTGIGIAPNDVPTVLDPFMQIDSQVAREHAGTGLGLPLSKALTELHGGSFDLDSEIGVGTTVTLCFPEERIGLLTATGT